MLKFRVGYGEARFKEKVEESEEWIQGGRGTRLFEHMVGPGEKEINTMMTKIAFS